MAEAEQIVFSCMFRLMGTIVEQWRMLETQISDIDREIGTIAKTNDACQRLQTVPGVGPWAATAMVAAVGNGSAFDRGASFRHGWALYRSSAQRAAKQSFWESVNAETNTSEDCSFMAPARLVCRSSGKDTRGVHG
jgi:hypothetical protein